MPWLLGTLAVAVLGYTTKNVADAADTAGNASLKLAAAAALVGGTYFVIKRVS